MLQLIKKDLLVSLKIKSLKAVILTSIVGLFLLSIFSYIFPTILPIIITYVVVMNSFYYDSLNNAESYILSLPNKREDVVYSKYILVFLILFLSNILMYILFGINILNSTRVIVLYDVIVSSTTILFSFSIILPIIFKYRYKVGRVVAPFITIFIGYLSFRSNANTLNNFIENGKETVLISLSRKIGVLTYNIFKFNNYDYKVIAATIYIVLLFIIAIILFLVSNYITLKIYENRDLG
jgi:ABC-2 type transport system permease protein